MNLTSVVLAALLAMTCLVGGVALIRAFGVKFGTATPDQAQAERLLSQANQELQVRRRVRAGTSSHAMPDTWPQVSTLSTVRIRFPSA
jgi:hypothetical protein